MKSKKASEAASLLGYGASKWHGCRMGAVCGRKVTFDTSDMEVGNFFENVLKPE